MALLFGIDAAIRTSIVRAMQALQLNRKENTMETTEQKNETTLIVPRCLSALPENIEEILKQFEEQ